MPIIRVDLEVYSWIQSQASALEDTPNSVLRRVARLDVHLARQPLVDDRETIQPSSAGPSSATATVAQATLSGRLSGERLKREWNVPVRHALYHRDGRFYENLERFPGALFDPDGYVIFQTAERYQHSPHLRIGQKLNVPYGISSIPEYVKMGSSGNIGETG